MADKQSVVAQIRVDKLLFSAVEEHAPNGETMRYWSIARAPRALRPRSPRDSGGTNSHRATGSDRDRLAPLMKKSEA